MKIAIDLRPLMAGKVSGVEIYITSMLKELLELDQKNQYILWYNAFKKVDISGFPRQLSNVTLKRTRIPNKLLNLSLSLLRWPKVDRLIAKGVDVLWVPDPRPAPVSKRCKKIITFHDLSFEDFRYSFNFKTRLWHRLLRPRKEAREADRIVAVSKFTRNQLVEEYGLSKQKISVIYESVDKRMKPLAMPMAFNLLKRKYNLPKEYFLCLSTIEPRKNIRGTVESFIKWLNETKADVSLVIAGQAHDRIFAKSSLRNHPKILKIGFIDEENKALLYEHALAFLYPSFYEGFGLPILEAMRCGTPVITSDATSMPEVAGNAALLVNPNSSKELKNAMHSVYRDHKLRKELIEKGRRRVNQFSWKKAARQLLDMLTA
jgi:glycosyltransferase involved in cell wall biosynthesis